MPSNKQRARDYELDVLNALCSFGTLTRQQLSQFVYRAQTQMSAETRQVQMHKMTQRMLKSGRILKRINAAGTATFVLTNRGARELETAFGTPARAGYDLNAQTGYLYRNSLAFDALMRELDRGCQVIGIAQCTDQLAGLHGYVHDPSTGEQWGLVVVTNTHPDIIAKIRTLRKEHTVRLVGADRTVAHIEAELKKTRCLY